jgi:hypothetical protein
MMRSIVQICFLFSVTFPISLAAQASLENPDISSNQTPHYSQEKVPAHQAIGAGERAGCDVQRDFSLFSVEEYDCKCSGTPLVNCWVSTDNCPTGFHAECFEASTFKCGCYCRY